MVVHARRAGLAATAVLVLVLAGAQAALAQEPIGGEGPQGGNQGPTANQPPGGGNTPPGANTPPGGTDKADLSIELEAKVEWRHGNNPLLDVGGTGVVLVRHGRLLLLGLAQGGYGRSRGVRRRWRR